MMGVCSPEARTPARPPPPRHHACLAADPAAAAATPSASSPNLSAAATGRPSGSRVQPPPPAGPLSLRTHTAGSCETLDWWGYHRRLKSANRAPSGHGTEPLNSAARTTNCFYRVGDKMLTVGKKAMRVPKRAEYPCHESGKSMHRKSWSYCAIKSDLSGMLVRTKETKENTNG